MNNNSNNSHTPKLRFPGFTGEWEEKKIGEIADVLQGYGFPDKYQGQKIGQLPFCKVGDISAAVDKGERIISKAANYVDYSLLPILHAKPIPVSSTIFAKIGEAIRSNKRIKTGVPCLIDNNAAAIKAKDDGNDDFLFYLMSRINLADYSGGIVPSVNKSTIEAITVLLPPSKAEQQKIASFLSEIDDQIASQGQKVDALKEKKKGLMQQLFPRKGETVPRLRFPGITGEWEEKKIGEIADVMQGYGFPDKYQGQKIGQLPFYKVGDISAAVDKEERIISKAANYVDYSLLPILHAKPIPVGSTIFAKIGEAIRSNKRIKTGVPCLIDNNAAAVKAKDDGNDDFLFYLMSRINLADYSGGIVPSVNKSSIEAITVLLPPSQAEQQKIASCLSTLDDTITAETDKLEVLKNHKKGLMQQLFPQ